MKLISIGFLLLVCTSFCLQNNLANASPMSNLEIACDEIPNAVTNTLIKPPNYYDCKCDIGFEGPETFMPDDSDAKCIDIDECKNMMLCGADSVCINTKGSYQCKPCGQGYRNVNGACDDVDECTTGKAKCHPLAVCINILGSYECLCPRGFTGNGDSVSGCKDIDECRGNPCGEGAACVNHAGSFQCYCLKGYAFDIHKQRCIATASKLSAPGSA